ncbi:MAG: CsbD family protein [Chitinophagaceae bacterium]|nr:CsbD family protein [Chitinophagaceae bacterium]
MNVTFNRDVLTGKWKEIRGRAKQTWGKLTDDELDRISGRFDELTGLLQQRYGYSKEQAENEVTHFIEQMNPR